MILNYFQWNLNKLKCIVMFAMNIKNFKKIKYHILKKKSVFLLFTVSVVINMKKHLEKKNQLILKILGLIKNIEEYQKIYNYT